MVVCLRTVGVPPEWRDRYLEWIAEGRHVRQAHGILAELVCEPTSVRARRRHHHLARPRHLRRLDRHPRTDALTASEVHQAVDYRPITRHDVVGGYLNLPGLHKADLTPEEDI